jgi:rhodanese-related sulfurtransferase
MLTAIDPQKAAKYFESKLEFTTGPRELYSLITGNQNITVIDVRNAVDYRKGHIPGAVTLPREKWGTFQGLSRKGINVIYDYSEQCHLALIACKLFAEHGLYVQQLEGGFEACKKHSLPFEK